MQQLYRSSMDGKREKLMETVKSLISFEAGGVYTSELIVCTDTIKDLRGTLVMLFRGRIFL